MALEKHWRELFMNEREQVVPWPAQQTLIEPHYPKGSNGRQPVDLRIMQRRYLCSSGSTSRTHAWSGDV